MYSNSDICRRGIKLVLVNNILNVNRKINILKIISNFVFKLILEIVAQFFFTYFTILYRRSKQKNKSSTKKNYL